MDLPVDFTRRLDLMSTSFETRIRQSHKEHLQRKAYDHPVSAEPDHEVWSVEVSSVTQGCLGELGAACPSYSDQSHYDKTDDDLKTGP